MNTEKFSEAQEVYNAGDYRKSARLFLDAVEKGTPVGNGLAYHMAGNSFMRLKRYSDAAVVFEHALRDDTYSRRGSVEANLAHSYVRTGDYDSAIAHYESALALGEQENAYRYYQGVAQAYMQQQKFDLAAVAYKHAALDDYNPTPGKTLINLGLAMMAAGNARGAIEAYQTALTSPDYTNKGRALLNMGIAYHSVGMWSDSVAALEDAKLQPGYEESELARNTLEDSKQRIALEGQVAQVDHAIAQDYSEGLDDLAGDTDEISDVVGTDAFAAQPTNDYVDVEAQTPVDMAAATADDAGDRASMMSAADGFADGNSGDLYPKREVQVGNAEEVERFFARSENEAAAQGKEKMIKERGRFWWLKWVLIVVLLFGGIGGAGAAMYFTGQGIPSAETTVTDLLEAYIGGHTISEYWTFDAQDDIETKMVVIPTFVSFDIEAINPGPAETTVLATITTEAEERLSYTFVLVREGLGWKVNSVLMEGMDSLIDPEFGLEDFSDLDAMEVDFESGDFDDEMTFSDEIYLGDESPE